MTRSKKIILLVALGVALSVGVLAMFGWFTKAPDNLGVKDGRLAACPASPNCVSSQADDERHGMPAIPFVGDAADARARLKRVLASMPRAKIVEERDDYIRVEFTTLLMRFVDDAEFLIDAESNQIHFRSASRIGHSDLGANRKRMTTVGEAFESSTAVR